jgi:hypothetical protein
MMLVFSGTRTHDPDNLCVAYSVLLDGERIECAIDDAILGSLCDAYDDPVQTFDSCRMLILEYTRQRLRGTTTSICDHIALRDRRHSYLIADSM